MKAIEITKGANGYPQGLHRGYINFLNYKEADAFAKKHNGRIVLLHKKAGWQLWESKGNIYNTITRRIDEDYPEHHVFYWDSLDAFNDEALEHLVSLIDSKSINTDQLVILSQRMNQVYHRIEELKREEVLITNNFEDYEIYEWDCMGYTYDSHYYEIGVELDGYDDDADAESE